MKIIAVYFFLINGTWVHDAVLHPDVVAHDAKSCAIGQAMAEVVTTIWQERIKKGEMPTYKTVPVQGMKIECREEQGS